MRLPMAGNQANAGDDVVIEEENQVAACLQEPAVHGADRPGGLVPNPADGARAMPTAQKVGSRWSVVGGLIHHHDLIRRLRLRQQVPDGVRQDLVPAVGGDDDGEGHR